jgi:hypothetical protein
MARMTGSGGRVIGALLGAVVALLLVGSSFTAGWSRSSTSCGAAHHQCVQRSAPAPASAADPCLSQPSCGGGVHAGQVAPVVPPPGTVGALLAGALLLGALRRRRVRAAFTGRLAAGGLFRPPRLAV